MNDNPEQILTRLFLNMFSTEELRMLIRFSFGDDLTHALPGQTAAPMQVAAAASAELIQRGCVDQLWPVLHEKRPRRSAEIEAVRKLFPPGPTPPNNGGDGGKIRLLFVLTCPRSQEQLATQEEVRAIEKEMIASRHRDRFIHKVVLAATYKDLREALREHRPDILHISCHGTDTAELLFNDGGGGEMYVDARALAGMFVVLKLDIRLIVLNACHSTTITRELAPLVPLLVGMRGAVHDSSAVAFATVFYESLVAGDTVEDSFNLAINELYVRRANSNIPQLLPATGEQRQFRFVTA